MYLQPETQHYHYVTNVRENSVPTMSSQMMSPYSVLPPVGSARKVYVLRFCAKSFSEETSYRSFRLCSQTDFAKAA